jgi:hypothetical protein
MTKDIIPADTKAVEQGKAKPVECLVPEVVDDIEHKEPTRDELLIRNLFLYDTKKEAAIEAGFSESYADSRLYQRINSPEFQQKIIDYAKANNVLNLPKIATLECKAINHLATLDGDDLIKGLAKSKHTLTQTKQIAGLLRPEDTGSQAPVTINVKSLRQLNIKA